MKTVLNLVSLAALSALGVGIYVTQGGERPDPIAETVVTDAATDSVDVGLADEASSVDPATEAPRTGRYTVEGTQPGYFIATGDVRFGDIAMTSILVEPNGGGWGERVRLTLEDTSVIAGTNDFGEYYQGYPMEVEDWSVTPDGVSISAHHPELGPFSLTAVYDPAGYAEWTAHAEHVEHLLVADISLNGETLEDVSLGFWIGD